MDNCGLYIHIPFCKSKCSYCDFYSHCADEGTIDAYCDRLLEDIKNYAHQYKIKKFDSIFIGGGTPTVLNIRLCKIINAATKYFSISPSSEITVEANPESVTKELLTELHHCGVNRISMGVQSFNKEQLSLLGRIHSVNDIYVAAESLSYSGINNWNLDLMFGIPIQDKSIAPVCIWEDTITKAISLNPTHISAYSLTLEKNTPLYKIKDELYFPSEEEEDIMYNILCEKTKENLYSHYEISNYAKKGFECKHNLKYWQHSEYLGLGTGAHSYINCKRFSIVSNINAYCKGEELVNEYESVNAEEGAYETLITGLRLRQGIDLNNIKDYFNIEAMLDYAKKLEGYGLINVNENVIALTEKGFRVSNTVINRLINYKK